MQICIAIPNINEKKVPQTETKARKKKGDPISILVEQRCAVRK